MLIPSHILTLKLEGFIFALNILTIFLLDRVLKELIKIKPMHHHDQD